MAAPVIAVVAKKAAAIILSDKRPWTPIGSVIGGIVVFIILAVTVIFGGISAHNTAVQEGNSAMRTALNKVFTDGELPPGLPQEYADGINNLKGMMTSVETEIKNQGLDTDPLKAQVILLCVLTGRVNDPNFYPDYISCFAGTQDDNQIFNNISAKFGITLTSDDRTHILQLYQQAVAYTAVPPSSIHNEIAELLKTAPAVPVNADPLRAPIHVANWKDLITSGYGYRDDPVTGEKHVSHSGIDIAVPISTDVYAAKAGKVLFVRYDENGYGNYLAVNHGGAGSPGGGVVTLYGHCSEILVSEGQDVTADTVIARSGSTGKSTGPHLHFEVIVDGQPENPMKFLQ